MDNEPIDTANKYMVSVKGDRIGIIDPPMGTISKPDALGFAAWLVALADDHNTFPGVLAAIRNT